MVTSLLYLTLKSVSKLFFVAISIYYNKTTLNTNNIIFKSYYFFDTILTTLNPITCIFIFV